MDPWAPPSSVTSSTLTAEQQQAVDAAVQSRTSHIESVLSLLINEVRSLKASDTGPGNANLKMNLQLPRAPRLKLDPITQLNSHPARRRNPPLQYPMILCF